MDEHVVFLPLRCSKCQLRVSHSSSSPLSSEQVESVRNDCRTVYPTESRQSRSQQATAAWSIFRLPGGECRSIQSGKNRCGSVRFRLPQVGLSRSAFRSPRWLSASQPRCATNANERNSAFYYRTDPSKKRRSIPVRRGNFPLCLLHERLHTHVIYGAQCAVNVIFSHWGRRWVNRRCVKQRRATSAFRKAVCVRVCNGKAHGAKMETDSLRLEPLLFLVLFFSPTLPFVRAGRVFNFVPLASFRYFCTFPLRTSLQTWVTSKEKWNWCEVCLCQNCSEITFLLCVLFRALATLGSHLFVSSPLPWLAFVSFNLFLVPPIFGLLATLPRCDRSRSVENLAHKNE